jgi:DNA-binding response OmpR family regulator
MRVVIAEDEADLRVMLAEEITDLGHEVFQASNGKDAVDLVARVRPHLICSDINMPEMSGHEFKERLESEGLTDSKTVFIFVSANATQTDIADGLMAGAAHYFTKPINYDRLCAVLDATEATLLS